MEVYGEYLFLENFITGLLILLLTGKLCGRKYSMVRIVIGSVLCGGYSFALFFPMSWLVALVGKLAFSVVAVTVSFGLINRKTFVKTLIVFYIVSFLMGGLTIAIMYVSKVPGLSGNGAVYLHGVTYLQVAVGVLLAYLLGGWFAGVLKGKLQKERVFTDMSIEIKEQSWNLRAFVDTGNFLREPISGHPAVVLSADCGRRILESLAKEELVCRQCIIPYRSVGRRGIMNGLRPDKIIVEGRPIEKVVLAISDGTFNSWRGEETYEVLLQQQIIEEGASNYAK